MSVVVSTPNYSSEYPVSSEKSSLKFEPGVVQKLLCEFNCDPADAGKDIQIGYVLLTIGSAKEHSAILKFSAPAGNGSSSVDKLQNEFQRFR